MGLLAATQKVLAFVAPRRRSTTRPNAASSTKTALEVAVVGPEVATDAITAVTSSSSHIMAAEYPVSPEPIHSAFKVATFYGQIFFILMILFPKSTITKKIMGGLGKCNILH